MEDPSCGVRAEPYFGLNGAVTIESLAHDLNTAKGLGFHAVTAQAGGGMTTPYLTPEYFAFLNNSPKRPRSAT